VRRSLTVRRYCEDEEFGAGAEAGQDDCQRDDAVRKCGSSPSRPAGSALSIFWFNNALSFRLRPASPTFPSRDGERTWQRILTKSLI